MIEKFFDQQALERFKVGPNLIKLKKSKISAHSCAQTLSLAKIFFSYTVSLKPNLEYTTNLRSVSPELKGVRHDFQKLSIFIKIKNFRKLLKQAESSLYDCIYTIMSKLIKINSKFTKKSSLKCKKTQNGARKSKTGIFQIDFLARRGQNEPKR